jgi:hypothetical protein
VGLHFKIAESHFGDLISVSLNLLIFHLQRRADLREHEKGASILSDMIGLVIAVGIIFVLCVLLKKFSK